MIIIIVVLDNHGTSVAYRISRCCLSRHEQRKRKKGNFQRRSGPKDVPGYPCGCYPSVPLALPRLLPDGQSFHLLIETPDGNLSLGMRQLNGVYTQAFNKRHRRAGHLFQGRYKAILIQKDSHLTEVCRYVVLNPVRALGDRERVDLEGGQRAGHSWGR